MFFYALALAGSVSLGYSILKTGWPENQEGPTSEKIVYSYLIGVPMVAVSTTLGNYYFFPFLFGVYASIFMIALITRVATGKKDSVKLKEKKRREKIPERALTREERQGRKKHAEEKEKKESFKKEKTNILKQLRNDIEKAEKESPKQKPVKKEEKKEPVKEPPAKKEKAEEPVKGEPGKEVKVDDLEEIKL